MPDKTKVMDERNFRSSYYEKVGCRGVEEKKSLEILMKEKPWDKLKLKQFCLRYTVPAAYRNLVWKVLLAVDCKNIANHLFPKDAKRKKQWIKAMRRKNQPSNYLRLCAVHFKPNGFFERNSYTDILPVYPDSHQFVMEQRTEQYHDLLYAVEMLEMIDMNAPRAEILMEMWLLEDEEREPPIWSETNANSGDTFLPICTSLLSQYSDEVDVYWFTKSLTDVVRNMQKDQGKMKEAFNTMLEKEDGEVYSHLMDINALEVLPLTKWFNCCFAGVLDEISIAKIWDKLCSGAPKILPFVAVMLIITLRRNILRAKTPEDILKCVSEISEQCEELVANKAIDLWQYYGAQPQNDQLAIKK